MRRRRGTLHVAALSQSADHAPRTFARIFSRVGAGEGKTVQEESSRSVAIILSAAVYGVGVDKE